MKRMSMVGIWLLIVGCAGLLLGSASGDAFAAESKEIVITARHLNLSGLSQLGAVTFIHRDDEEEEDEEDSGKGGGSDEDSGKGSGEDDEGSGEGGGSARRLDGPPLWQRALAWVGLWPANAYATAAYIFTVDGDEAAKDRIDGHNYVIDGEVPLGSGDVPGIALDVLDDYLETSDVTVDGSVAIQENVATVDVKAYIDYYANRADITITSNTTYDGGTIGGPTDYQIVHLQDAKLFLQGDFKGYGLLVIEDTNPGGGLPELRMEDTAKWYGAILVYSVDTPGSSDKMRLRFGKQNGSGGSGSGEGSGEDSGEGSGEDSGKGSGSSRLMDEPSLWERALAWVGLVASDAHADSGKGSGEDDSGDGKGSGEDEDSGKGSGEEEEDDDVGAGEGVKVYGMILAQGRDVEIEFPNGGAVADIWYCSEAVTAVDNRINTSRFMWEGWRENE